MHFKCSEKRAEMDENGSHPKMHQDPEGTLRMLSLGEGPWRAGLKQTKLGLFCVGKGIFGLGQPIWIRIYQ